MRILHITEKMVELAELPETLPEHGFLWIGCGRRQFEVQRERLQTLLENWTGQPLVDLHVQDLLSAQRPSSFDYTSHYDLLVFRRLAASADSAKLFLDDEHGTLSSAKEALRSIDTSPVGFAVFDRVLITVHPADCPIREGFIHRLRQMSATHVQTGVQARLANLRLPPSPADLMLRMVNQMVDSYLELRRLLTRQLSYLQAQLLSPNSNFDHWQLLLDARNALHLLEDNCEDQRAAIGEWLDVMHEWPAPQTEGEARDRELLRVRSRDVIEHIERVLSHVRRLESSAEAAVQMHFSAQSHRTNAIMRTLTVLTAVFLPLNLITGFFGMNFEFLPLIHQHNGIWLATLIMLAVGFGLLWIFWKKRYLGRRN